MSLYQMKSCPFRLKRYLILGDSILIHILLISTPQNISPGYSIRL